MVCTECGAVFDAEKNKLSGRRGCSGCSGPASIHVCPKCGQKHYSDGTAYKEPEQEE